MLPTTRTRGASAEQAVLKYLKKQGLKLIQQNYQTRTGEIDLILRDQDCIVFTEVRLRNNTDFGSGAETVTIRKQQKIAKTALLWLQSEKLLENSPCRFDIVSVVQQDKRWHFEWIPHAFDASVLS